jgi:hypothetical protein
MNVAKGFRLLVAIVATAVLAVSTVGSTDSPANAAAPGPTFVYPSDGQVLGYDGALLFQVSAVPGASGYLYGFFQGSVMVWENYRDEHTLSGTEYGVQPGSPGHGAIQPGALQVWVRGLVDNQWTDATIINIVLQSPLPGGQSPPASGGDPPFFCINGPGGSCDGTEPAPTPEGHMTWNQYLDWLDQFADGVAGSNTRINCVAGAAGGDPAAAIIACLTPLLDKFPPARIALSLAVCASGAAGPAAIISCVGVGAAGIKLITASIRAAAAYDPALRDFLNAKMI